MNAKNSIIADNKASPAATQDVSGSLTSQGYNLIENTLGAVVSGVQTGNIIGVDPQLAPLANYGGTTSTFALQPTSPAVDTADPNSFPATDQRGIERSQDSDFNGSALPDIGSFERQLPVAFTVTKNTDTNDNVCDADCSLREAIAAANLNISAEKVIIFNSSFNSEQLIKLTLGELQINNGSLFINGPGNNLLTISGNDQNRVFSIGNAVRVEINGIKITSGKVVGGQGGAILNNGVLMINNSDVFGNSAKYGGGIYNNGALDLLNSTIANNAATEFGGGILNNAGGSVEILLSVIR